MKICVMFKKGNYKIIDNVESFKRYNALKQIVIHQVGILESIEINEDEIVELAIIYK